MSSSIRSVERALDILLCFSRQTPELSMTQIAERIGMNKSTVHRMLATLEAKRFLQREPLTGVYRPGIRLLQMAFLTLGQHDLRRLAAPFLRKLSDQHRETVTLSVLDDSDMVYVDVVDSPQRVKMAAESGQRLPAFSTASGKALLAFLPEDIMRRVLENGMPQYTPNTILSPEKFFENAQLTRQRGFALSDQEYENEINAVAAPILDQNGHPLASVAVAGPSYRLTHAKMLDIGPSVSAVAKEIAHEFDMAHNPEMHPG